MNKQRVELLLAAVLLLPCAGRAQNTVSLEQLWALADEQVTSLKIERAAVESAEHDVAVNAASRLPDISTELSVGYLGDGVLFNRDYTNSMHIDNPHFTNNFALRAQQTIYSGGAVSAGIDIAKLNREMAKLNYATNREEVRFVIASHYLDLCRMQNRMKVVEKNIALTQDILRNINSRYNNGTALKTDIMRYELQLEALQLNQIKLLDAKKTISHTLATLLHLNAATLLPNMLLLGMKAVYGWACYGCIALILGFLLFDSPIRRHRSYMLPWHFVGKMLKRYYSLEK